MKTNQNHTHTWVKKIINFWEYSLQLSSGYVTFLLLLEHQNLTYPRLKYYLY
jgi:hypothetical protein